VCFWVSCYISISFRLVVFQPLSNLCLHCNKKYQAMPWSNLSSRQSSYDGKSTVVLRGSPIATLPRISRNDSHEILGMPQIMSGIASVSRAIGEATGFTHAAETDNSNSVEKDGSLLSSEMKTHILEEVAQSRQKLHTAVLNMESGSQEWQEMQKSFRQTNTMTNFGLAMALQCQLIDKTVNSSCVDSSSAAHQRSDGRVLQYDTLSKTPEPGDHRNGGRCGSSPSLSLDSRRHLFKKESFKLIKTRSHHQLLAAQEQKEFRPRIGHMPSQLQDVLLTMGTKCHIKKTSKVSVTKKKDEQPSVAVAQNVVQPHPPRPEWRVVENFASRNHLIDRRSSWQSRLSSSRTSLSSMGLASFLGSRASANDDEMHTSSYEEETTSLKNRTFLPRTEGMQQAEESLLKKEARIVASQLFGSEEGDNSDSDNDDYGVFFSWPEETDH
jgi:hypothetical protein